MLFYFYQEEALQKAARGVNGAKKLTYLYLLSSLILLLANKVNYTSELTFLKTGLKEKCLVNEDHDCEENPAPVVRVINNRPTETSSAAAQSTNEG